MVTVSPGKHRRFDAELPPAPDGMPFSSAEYLPSPVDVADPLADANGTWGPGRGGTLTDPDWPPDLGGTGSWLQWDGGTVPNMARAVYEERAFDRLPVLADALEEAGCSEAGLLTHLRGAGPHARGCWAVDRILGKG